ncbi:threonine-phosphate decarboxylase CobD [Frigidibacter mobilis]|uniref:threonine-phosphate decarboxylase n=1 Tax=Frigidibacter mobilis TaxID=1335048 RepID=A0A159YY26_9RHOB|nr:threonine-phosphate decarboxylase CobD [Frigidibacter mobilis]AMY67336.1 aminotransferase [Frigidibacter mobilis]
MRDHGGNLDAARVRYGGDRWVDLSTGINRLPWPMPPLPDWALTALPPAPALAALVAAARGAWQTPAAILPLAGAQAAIQLVPRLDPPGRARVLGPTYNEHAAALRACGWQVEEVDRPQALAGAGLAVIVNPNNPDGRALPREAVLALAGQVGRLVVDESFADPVPQLSVAAEAGASGLIVLRSFGKFYGLAGLRLGFALGSGEDIARLAEMAGPWPVSGPAIHAGTLALADRAWAHATTARLAADGRRMDALAARTGWQLVGGTHLFRLYDAPSAEGAQDGLARGGVWSRIFPWSSNLIRLGLPGPEAEWRQVAAAFEALSAGQGQQG